LCYSGVADKLLVTRGLFYVEPCRRLAVPLLGLFFKLDMSKHWLVAADAECRATLTKRVNEHHAVAGGDIFQN